MTLPYPEKYYKIERLMTEYQNTGVPEVVEVEQWEEQLSSTSQNTRFHVLLRQRSIKLQNRVSAIMKSLDFEARSDTPALIVAIEHFKTTEGRVGEQPPVDFLTTSELDAVNKDDSFDIPLYKCLLFTHTADAIKSGQLNLLHSYRFRAIQNYMIEQSHWDKNRSALLQEAGMESFADGKLVLDQIKIRLQSRYKDTNERFLAGDNPHISVDKSGRCLVAHLRLNPTTHPLFLQYSPGIALCQFNRFCPKWTECLATRNASSISASNTTK